MSYLVAVLEYERACAVAALYYRCGAADPVAGTDRLDREGGQAEVIGGRFSQYGGRDLTPNGVTGIEGFLLVRSAGVSLRCCANFALMVAVSSG